MKKMIWLLAAAALVVSLCHKLVFAEGERTVHYAGYSAQETGKDKGEFLRNCKQLEAVINGFDFNSYRNMLQPETFDYILSIRNEALAEVNKARKSGSGKKGYILLKKARVTTDDIMAIEEYLLKTEAERLAKTTQRMLQLLRKSESPSQCSS